MGKNKDDDIDEFGLDDLDADLDFGDWDAPEDGSGGTDSRDPITQSAKTIKNAAVGAVFPKSQRDRIILDALPEAATGAYEGYQDVNSAISDVYSHTKEELIKTQRTLKIQTRQLLPTMKKYLPDTITSKVDAWARPEELFGSNYDPNTALLDRGLSDVFGALQQQNENNENIRRESEAQSQSERVESGIKETVSNLKQDKLLEVMVGMAKDTNSAYQLQSSIGVNYQRKTLELNYRQLFALQEIAKLGQSRFERDTPALEAIVKNTALPDYAKEEFGEIQGAMFKRKIAEWISPARFTEDFITKMQDNAKKKVSEALGEGRSLMDLIMGGLQEDDDIGLEDSSVVAPDAQKQNLTQKGIGSAAGWLAHKYINPQRDKLTAKIREKMSENEDVDKFFNKALYNFTNIPQIANSALSDERESTLGSFFKVMETMGITPEYRRENVALETRDADRLDKVAKFDHRSYLTLNETIPAWLSKINQSVRASFGEDVDEVYDTTSRSFVDKNVVAGRVRAYVGADENRERMRGRIREVTDLVDDGSMDSKMRAKVGSFLESRISEAKEFNVDALLENSDILDRHMDWDTKDKFVEMLRAKSNGNGAKLSNQVNGEINAMRGSVDSYQRRLNEMVAQYGDKAVLDSGIINYNKDTDTLETNKDLTNLYKDVGKLQPKQMDDQTRLRMEARARASQSNATPNGQNLGSGLTSATLTGGISKTDLTDILYGNKPTTLVELLKREQAEDPVLTASHDAVIAALERVSSKDEITQILKHIKTMDEEGVLTLSGGTLEVEDADDSDSGKARKRKLKKLRKGRRVYRNDEHKGLFRRWGSLGADTAGRLGNGFMSFAGGTKRALTGARTRIGLSNDRMKTIALSPFKTAINAARAAGNGMGAFGKAAVGARDIYGADGKVVLSGAQLKAGGYFKRVSGKLVPMKTLDELKDATGVYDSEGNTILDEKQLANAGTLSYYKDKKWWKVTEIVGGGTGSLVNKILNMPKDLLGGKDNLARKALRWFKEVPDMYIGDKLVIRANLMREGHYTCNGKVINKPEDIKGEVNDINGNIVISKADFEKEGFEITDRWGRQVRTPLGRMAGRVGGVFGFAASKIRNIPANIKKFKDGVLNSRPGDFLKRKVGDPIANAAMWLPRKIMGKGTPGNKDKKDGAGWFSQNKLFNLGGGSNKTNDILIHIYQLLNKRLSGESESEDWLGDYKKGSSKVAEEAISKVKEKARKFKDDKLAALNAHRKSIGERFNLKGKLGKFKPKDLMASLTARFKGINGGGVDFSDAKDKLLNRTGASANFYRDKMAKNIADRERSFVSRVKGFDLKGKLGSYHDDIISRGKDFGNRKDVRGAKRNVKDFISGRNRNLDDAAMSLLDGRSGTRDHYRDHLAKRISEMKGTEKENMTTGFRGMVNSTLFGMKQKDPRSISAKLKGKFSGEDSVQSKILSKLTHMNEASQGMWFTTMRKSAEVGGMGASGLASLTDRFSKRFSFGKKSAGGEWFKFMKRGRGGSETLEGADDASGNTGAKKKKSSGFKWVDLLLAGMGAMFGGLPGAIAGALLRPLGGILAKVAGKGVMGMAAKALPMLGGAMASGVAAVGGAVATAGTALATGVAAVGALPVIVGGALIAAVGWGIYKAATRKRAFYLDKMRLAQYGVQDYDLWSSDEAAKVLYLEDNLKKYISFETTGVAVMRGLSAEEAVNLGVGYGIDKENEKELVAFHSYLQSRFIPIYLNWYAAIRKLETAPALADIGNAMKVGKKEMQKVFDECKLKADAPCLQHSVDARKADRGWFKSATDWAGMTTSQLLSGAEVEEVQATVGAEIAARDEERETRGQKGFARIETSGLEGKFDTLDNAKNNAIHTNAMVARGRVAAVDENGKSNVNEDYTFSATHVGKKKAKLETLNALQGLRLKTYGLVDLNSVDVQTILDVEEIVLPYINTETGTYTGMIEDVLKLFGAGGENEHTEKVRYWFRNRFLPVFATYVMAVKRYLPSADPTKLVLSGRYLYEIASLVMQCKTVINGMETSVWYVRTLPFEGQVNDDPSSVIEELNTLKKLSKSTELNVDTLPKDTTTARVKVNSKKYDGSALAKIQQGQPDNSPGGSSSMGLAGKNDLGSASMGNIDLSTLKNAPVLNQEAVDGDYKSITSGSQEVPDIIQEAAAVAGVNPMLMLTMAMMESSLNPNAKASTSSAKGLFQFLDATWDDQMKKHANKYGIPEGTSPLDPVASALMGAEFLKANGKVSEGITGKPASAVDYYIPHFLGAGGARKFYRAMMKDPNAPAALTMSREAKANPSIFYRNGKPRSFAEVYQVFTSKMSSNESHVRKYVPGSSASPASNVIDMFKNVPKHNDKRRTEIVKAKASRDVSAVTTTTNSSAMAAPSSIYDNAGGSNVSDIKTPLANKAKEFAANNPNATEEDKETYATEATATVAASPVAQISPRHDELLSAQVTLQQTMVAELVAIRKLLIIVLDGKTDSQEYKQVKRDIETKPSPSITVEHGKSLINTKRAVNM